MHRQLFVLFSFIVCLFGSPVQGADVTYPQRIVSLGPINTENVFLLGAGDRLVANTSYCVRPEAAKAREKIGSVMQVSIEKIIGLQPDLVLATGLTSMQQIKQLESVGINVVQFKQPSSLADICTQFLLLGQLLGLENRAKSLISETKERLNNLEKKIAGAPPQKVFLQVGSQPLFSSVPSSFTNDFIVLAGGSNIAADQQKGTTNYEKVIAANPDVIIIAMMGSESGIASKERERWMQMPVISAVQNNRVHVISPDIACSPSPATFTDTLEIMARLIHPELYTQ